MGAAGATATALAMVLSLVGLAWIVVMTFHMLLVGTAAARGSEDDERSLVSRMFQNGMGPAICAIVLVALTTGVAVARAGGLAGIRRRREPVPYLAAVNFPADPKFDMFGAGHLLGAAPKTCLAKVLAAIDRALYLICGLRIVETDWAWFARSAVKAESTPALRQVFGPQDDFREGVAALAADFANGAPFARTAGLVGFRGFLNKACRTREAIISYVSAHPEVAKIPIRRPLLLIGLPRTGTTLLHRLLSLDPVVRTLRNWECISPVRHTLLCPYAVVSYHEADCSNAGRSLRRGGRRTSRTAGSHPSGRRGA